MKYEEETISFEASSVRRHLGHLISVLIYPHLRGRRDIGPLWYIRTVGNYSCRSI